MVSCSAASGCLAEADPGTVFLQDDIQRLRCPRRNWNDETEASRRPRRPAKGQRAQALPKNGVFEIEVS